MGVEMVTGERVSQDNPALAPGALPPIKQSRVAMGAAKKLISGDHNWQGNRPADDPHNQWHNFHGQRHNNILFGDLHAAFFNFPEAVVVAANNDPDFNPAPDPFSPYGYW